VLLKLNGRKPKLLDLYCGAGGASKGYADAGFEIVGVDICSMPSYPYEFHQADAMTFPLDGFDAIHASPPCQAHTALRYTSGKASQSLVADTRGRLLAVGVPWIIENVPGAPLVEPVTLCGSMFDLGSHGYRLIRHRLFEASFEIPQPVDRCQQDPRPVVGIYGGKVRNRRAVAYGSPRSRVGTTLPLEIGTEAMGITWMDRQRLSQAIPSAYTRYIGGYLMAVVRAAPGRVFAA
jgi:DNA (cytosine-5)-methyltransferase 1